MFWGRPLSFSRFTEGPIGPSFFCLIDHQLLSTLGRHYLLESVQNPHGKRIS